MTSILNDELFEVIMNLKEQNISSEELETEVWRSFGCNVAMLIMDSSGFTRVSRSHGIVHYLSLIADLRLILTPVFKKSECLFLKYAADNIYVAYTSVEAALEASIEANATLTDKGLMLTEDEPFAISVGIGYGKCLKSEREGFFGNEVNLASKLGEDIAEAREILLTEAAFNQLHTAQKLDFEKLSNNYSGISINYYRIINRSV